MTLSPTHFFTFIISSEYFVDYTKPFQGVLINQLAQDHRGLADHLDQMVVLADQMVLTVDHLDLMDLMVLMVDQVVLMGQMDQMDLMDLTVPMDLMVLMGLMALMDLMDQMDHMGLVTVQVLKEQVQVIIHQQVVRVHLENQADQVT